MDDKNGIVFGLACELRGVKFEEFYTVSVVCGLIF